MTLLGVLLAGGLAWLLLRVVILPRLERRVLAAPSARMAATARVYCLVDFAATLLLLSLLAGTSLAAMLAWTLPSEGAELATLERALERAWDWEERFDTLNIWWNVVVLGLLVLALALTSWRTGVRHPSRVRDGIEAASSAKGIGERVVRVLHSSGWLAALGRGNRLMFRAGLLVTLPTLMAVGSDYARRRLVERVDILALEVAISSREGGHVVLAEIPDSPDAVRDLNGRIAKSFEDALESSHVWNRIAGRVVVDAGRSPAPEWLEDAVKYPKAGSLEDAVKYPKAGSLEDAVKYPKAGSLEDAVKYPKAGSLEDAVKYPKAGSLEDAVKYPKAGSLEDAVKYPKAGSLEEQRRIFEGELKTLERELKNNFDTAAPAKSAMRTKLERIHRVRPRLWRRLAAAFGSFEAPATQGNALRATLTHLSGLSAEWADERFATDQLFETAEEALGHRPLDGFFRAQSNDFLAELVGAGPEAAHARVRNARAGPWAADLDELEGVKHELLRATENLGELRPKPNIELRSRRWLAETSERVAREAGSIRKAPGRWLRKTLKVLGPVAVVVVVWDWATNDEEDPGLPRIVPGIVSRDEDWCKRFEDVGKECPPRPRIGPSGRPDMIGVP